MTSISTLAPREAAKADADDAPRPALGMRAPAAASPLPLTGRGRGWGERSGSGVSDGASSIPPPLTPPREGEGDEQTASSQHSSIVRANGDASHLADASAAIVDSSSHPVAANSSAFSAIPAWALGLIVPLLLAAGWELAVWLGLANGRLLPPPSRIIATLSELAASGELVRHIAATTARVAAGFGLGVLAGTLIGAIAGYSGLVNRLIDPTLQGLRSIPSIAWVPLFILWLGIFEASKVALIAVGVFFPVYLGVMGAIVAVDRKIVEVGRIFRLSGPALVRRILLPAILPAYIVALRGGLGLGWMFVVAAEFMGASEGLGYLLVDGQQLGKPEQIVAAIITFAILGKATDSLIALASRPFLRWQDAFQPNP